MKNSSLFRPRKIAYKTPATICLCIKPERYIYTKLKTLPNLVINAFFKNR